MLMFIGTGYRRRPSVEDGNLSDSGLSAAIGIHDDSYRTPTETNQADWLGALALDLHHTQPCGWAGSDTRPVLPRVSTSGFRT